MSLNQAVQNFMLMTERTLFFHNQSLLSHNHNNWRLKCQFCKFELKILKLFSVEHNQTIEYVWFSFE